MRHTNRTLFAVAVAACTTAILPLAASAHKGATGVVKTRMEAMKEMGKDMKALSFMVKGRRPYDSTAARRAAARLARHATEVPKLFPKGSMHGPSEALPEIWTDWERFKKLASDLATYAGQLEGSPAGTRDSARPVVEEIGSTCSACHKSFRKDEKK